MNNEKKQLLQNPLVKEIAEDFAKQFLFTEKGDKILFWDDFVKSQEPVMEWEIVSGKCSASFMGCPTPPETIISVRRLSDGLVFSVGDEVGTSNITLKIVDLYLSENGQMIFNGHYLLSGFQKARTPLFTTEDGKPVFEGDEVWVVHPLDFRKTKSVATKLEKIPETYPIFNNKEDCEEFILLNRPCLSISDVISTLENEKMIKCNFKETSFAKSLIELAKAKQNKC